MSMQPYEKEHLDFVLNNAAECTVLLKSDGRFPLPGPCRIAAYGAGLRYTVKGGTGSGEVNSRVSYTIEQSLEREGFTLTTKDWLDRYDQVRAEAKKVFYKKLKAQAWAAHENPILYALGKEMAEPDYEEIGLSAEGDAAIYVVRRNSGEGSDRTAVEGDVKLTKAEVRDILALEKKFERFLLVLNVGGVVDLSPVAQVGNILLLSQLGVDCGKVLADILTGRQNPSGKLSTTWAAYENYSKEGTFGDRNEVRYKEGIYVGYRYFDTFHKQALFPFGWGLSYTDFVLKTESVTIDADTVSVTVGVKNTGSCAGKEVVQVYVSLPEDRLDKAYQELAGFAKTSLLLSGGSETVRIQFRLSDLASYDPETESYLLEKGGYLVRVGSSSVSTTVAAVISLDETAVVKKVKNCLGTPDFADIRASKRSPEAVPAGAVCLSVRADSILCIETEYDLAPEIDSRVKALSDEELVYFSVGNFNAEAKGLSVIGNAGVHVAGAAGETAGQLESKGIRPLIMADGPAGLRLCTKYYEDEKGAHSADENTLPSSIWEAMGPVARWAAKLVMGTNRIPADAVIKEQAATMIPVGTAIAQSFNPVLAEQFGSLVGAEMERFGVNLWLAPALNIHRSILCGRNFEYYSEDPLLSGKMAAAITKGVQSHPGCGTTIKHFCANNAETNRYNSNSQVSERALREIYLRGFGIAVKEADPRAVMTSYNLLNGTHTSEHSGLIEDVLRCEFGFRGILMTDWIIGSLSSGKSVHRGALAPEVAKAGGGIFMPGGRKEYRQILSAFQKGLISREKLERNAIRILTIADEMLEEE